MLCTSVSASYSKSRTARGNTLIDSGVVFGQVPGNLYKLCSNTTLLTKGFILSKTGLK